MHSINTGFGTKWETEAIDLYQRKVGWIVEKRNVEIRTWPFQLDENNNGIPTVKPLRPAHIAYQIFSDDSHSEQSSNTEDERNAKRQKTIKGEDQVVEIDDTTNSNDEDQCSSSPQTTDLTPSFFSLRGSIDGIRQELGPGGPNDDDSWVLKWVVVECKHRMHQLKPSPPLHEMIQAAAYCFMYQVEDADIVQVLRLETNTKTTETADKKQNFPSKEAKVQELKFEADAKGITQKAEAMKLFDGVGREHEEFKLRLNKEKDIEIAGIQAQEEIAKQKAETSLTKEKDKKTVETETHKAKIIKY